MSATLTFGVAIPAYGDPQRLAACLRSIQSASPTLASRIAVTDDSGDGHIADALRSEFANIRWVVHDMNLGFGRSANNAVVACKADIVILLNDDVELLADPLAHLTNAFSDPTLFAVTFRSQNGQGVFREGAKRLVWPMGFPRILHSEKDQQPPVDGVAPSTYAVGGHAAYHRTRFLALHGFDPLFDPFYWEDVDLCARAARAGWKTVYLPECVVRHEDHGAIKSHFDRDRIREITLRNRLLFAWRHLPTHLFLPHLLSLLFGILQAVIPRNRIMLRALLAARRRWREHQKVGS